MDHPVRGAGWLGGGARRDGHRGGGDRGTQFHPQPDGVHLRLLFAMAAALAGYNAWAYVYDFPDIAWFDRAPRILEHRPVRCGAGAGAGRRAGRLAASAPGLCRAPGIAHTDSAHTGDAGDRRRLLAASSPIAVIAALILLVDVVVFAKAAITRAPAPTILSEHLNALGGNSCGLADKVLVEIDPMRGC